MVMTAQLICHATTKLKKNSASDISHITKHFLFGYIRYDQCFSFCLETLENMNPLGAVESY